MIGIRGSARDLLRTIVSVPPPRHLAKRFRAVTPETLAAIDASLRRHYFSDDPARLETPAGRGEFADHLTKRLDKMRHTIIPWLDNARPLDGMRVLEIGCGTGSSTLALAEQGAVVTAIDIRPESIEVARERCELCGVTAEFVDANAVEIDTVFSGRRFELIIFFAALEHMTHDERMRAMEMSWGMLTPGDLWCVTATPNRLWYRDTHTSLLPFYGWLPDDLAFRYSQYSPRPSFKDQYREMSDEAMLSFLRRGRGVSYHEFELTMGDATKLDVVSSLPGYLRSRNALRALRWRLSSDGRYERMLTRRGPGVHPGFYEETLDLVVRKR